MADRQKILRHIETSVDVDEWAVVGVKENFDKLDKIEKIINAPIGGKHMKYNKIVEILKQE